MKFPLLIWFIIFILLIISFFSKKITFWVSVIMYIILVFVRAKEIIGNYRDTENRNAKDEKMQLDQKAEEMAEKGMSLSGLRVQLENKIKEDFEFERRKLKRKFWVDFMNVLLLK